MNRHFHLLFLPVLIFLSCNAKNEGRIQPAGDSTQLMADPLPSWKNGSLKEAIISYVKTVADSSSKDFIPPADRIATFDNDGTLWAERPYVQELFIFYMVKKMAAKDPAIAKRQPFKAALENDQKYFARGGTKALEQLLVATHTGTTEDQFESDVRDFFATAVYPPHNVPMKKIVYQPQIELLDYLRENGFQTFICTGGTIEFVRCISQELYGIPKYQVIGTGFKYKYLEESRGILREPAVTLMNDGKGKPVGIQEHIGQRPVFACGNEGGAGDIAMLEYSQGGKYHSFQMLVNHNDPAREFFYQEKDSASLNAASKNNWHVASMKDDWEIIFSSPPEK